MTLSKLVFECGNQALRQHDHPVFAALAIAHDDYLAVKVNVFDPQAQTFHQAHAAAIKQRGQQFVLPIKFAQHCLNFGARQHHGNALFWHWPRQVIHPWHFNAQHFLIQKEQRTQSLPVGRNGHLALCDQVRQERFNFGLPHVTWMLQAVKPDEIFDPIHISLFGSEAIVQITNLLTQLIQQPG